MFEAYSTRARQVIFVARLKAGQRGAEMIEVDDMVAALVIEDQDIVEGLLSESFETKDSSTEFRFKIHHAFFSPDVASETLRKIEELLPKSNPVANSVEIPLSPSLKGTLDFVRVLVERLEQNHVEPLHLLAAVLAEESSNGARILKDSGITQEKVFEAIRGEM